MCQLVGSPEEIAVGGAGETCRQLLGIFANHLLCLWIRDTPVAVGYYLEAAEGFWKKLWLCRCERVVDEHAGGVKLILPVKMGGGKALTEASRGRERVNAKLQ